MPVVSRSFEHHARDETVQFDLVPLQFLREITLERIRVSHLSSPSTNLTRGLAARLGFDYLQYPMPQRHSTFSDIHTFSAI
ncbi:hypothetical protein TNCV_3475441 [Trichonephila clavipes]|nr:hypothetical protein TNCV_3475441 [Trichonephila clavipes]